MKKYFSLILFAVFLSACSMQGMVEKSVPDYVLKDNAAHIDQLLAKDSSRIIRVFKLNLEDEETKNQLETIFENVPSGKEIRRDYVGFNSSAGASLSEGKSREISLTTEVETDDGFMTVISNYALDSDGNCCAITNINVNKSDTSPARVALEAAGKVGRIIGLVFLGIVFGIIALIVFLRRRKAKNMS